MSRQRKVSWVSRCSGDCEVGWVCGGIAPDNNNGGGDLLGIGGFNAKTRADGTYGGQVQFKTVDAGTNALVSQLHGNVTCVGEAAGGYEIRLAVTTPPDPSRFGAHGSIFMDDDPAGDTVDESFAVAELGNSDCVGGGDVSWEPLLKATSKYLMS